MTTQILFAGFGAYFLYNGIRAIMNRDYYDPNAVPSATEEAGAVEEPVEPEEESEE